MFQSMFESVIVPIDGSTRDVRALAVAEAVAAQAGTSIDLFKVVLPAQVYEAKREIDEVADRLTATVGRREIITPGDVATVLAGEQLEHPQSLVCMATHARTGAREILLGGTAGDVLRRATRPVLLVGPHVVPPGDLGNVLVCIDGSAESEHALAPAATWADRMQGRLWLVQVSPLGGITNPAEFAQLQRAARTVEDRGLAVEWDVLHGRDVAHTIIAHAATLPASIIALTTHGHTGARDRLLGSVAMRVAHDATVPVLVQRAWR